MEISSSSTPLLRKQVAKITNHVSRSLARLVIQTLLHIILYLPVQQSNFTMTPQQWDEVNKFVETVGWDFVFGLNALLRTPYPNGSWDSDNGRMLLSYSTSKNYTVQWELGNGARLMGVVTNRISDNNIILLFAEPDMWGTPIPAEDHAKDFLTLRDLVAEEKTLGKMLIGPDVAYNRDYFTEYVIMYVFVM